MAPAAGGAAALLALIERLGFVQVDSINTVERAHHMILASRRRGYAPAQLTQLLEKQRSLFEHWTHDAAIIPTAFFPYWRLRFERDRPLLAARWRKWRPNGFEAELGRVHRHIADHGAVMARDIDRLLGAEKPKGQSGAGGGWWEWRPTKTALEFLWRTGALSVSGRRGFQKVFDLTERVIPEAHRTPQLAEAEIIDWACSGALDRLGFATSGEIAAFWDAVSPAEAKAWCAERLGQDLIEIEVEGASGAATKAFARPGVLDQATAAPPPPRRIRILSPFDPALRDRKRALRLFGFDYRIEVFTPAAKRRYGYYVFPVLEGDRLIGRIDMRREGENGPLIVTAFWPEPGLRLGQGRSAQLARAIEDSAAFAGCSAIRFADDWVQSAPPAA